MAVERNTERPQKGELTPDEMQQNDELRRRKTSKRPEMKFFNDPFQDFYDPKHDYGPLTPLADPFED